jgi:hypothetical protein
MVKLRGLVPGYNRELWNHWSNGVKRGLVYWGGYGTTAVVLMPEFAALEDSRETPILSSFPRFLRGKEERMGRGDLAPCIFE